MYSAAVHADMSCRFVIRPNQSLTWAQAGWVYLALAVMPILIAVACVLLGLWPVLPFAGAELLAVGAGFYVCLLRGQVVQVISITEDTVHVETGRELPQWSFEAVRAWTQVRLLRCENSWYPSRLVIRSHGREVEIGRFLSEDERQELAGELRRLIPAAT